MRGPGGPSGKGEGRWMAQGHITLNLTLTPKQAVQLLELLKDEVDWGYGLSPDLEALRRQLKEKLKGLRAQGLKAQGQ